MEQGLGQGRGAADGAQGREDVVVQADRVHPEFEVRQGIHTGRG
jgi:hypothetical protein